MTITESALSGINAELKLTNKSPPRSDNPNLPPLYFTALMLGVKHSGKTYTLVLIKFTIHMEIHWIKE